MFPNTGGPMWPTVCFRCINLIQYGKSPPSSSGLGQWVFSPLISGSNPDGGTTLSLNLASKIVVLVAKSSISVYYMNMNSYSCCTYDKQGFKQVTSLSSLLKIVGEESRLKILCILNDGQHCVCEIEEHVRSISKSDFPSLKRFKRCRAYKG